MQLGAIFVNPFQHFLIFKKADLSFSKREKRIGLRYKKQYNYHFHFGVSDLKLKF
jgi:hypothetical protein